MIKFLALLFSTPGPKYCFRCGAANSPGAPFCQACGAALPY